MKTGLSDIFHKQTVDDVVLYDTVLLVRVLKRMRKIIF